MPNSSTTNAPPGDTAAMLAAGEVPPAKILIVDDHPANLLALEAVLAPLGARIVRAQSGAEALDRLLRDDFAAIVLDVQMPEMDGFETAEIIRQRDRTRDVPILFVTAIHRDEVHTARGYGVGAVDYLAKPFDPTVLRAKVAAFAELWRRGEQLRRRELELFARERAQLVADEREAREQAEFHRGVAREREARLQALLLQSTVPIAIYRGPNHVYELANSAYRALFNNRDVVGKPVREALPELAGQGIFEILDGVYTTGEPFVAEELPVQIHRGAGDPSPGFFKLTVEATRGADGQIDGLAVIGIEVTEQVWARHRVTSILESMGDAFFALDRDWRVTMVNHNQERISKISREQSVGRVFWELFPATSEPTSRYWTEYHRCVAEQVPVHFEEFYEPLGLWTEVDAFPTPDGGLAVFFRDVTKRKQLEREREQLLASAQVSQEQFRTLVDTIPILAWYAEPDGHIPWYNQRWYEYTGTTLEAQAGWKWESVHDPVDLPRVVAKWKASIATGEPFEDEFRLRRHDGAFRWFLTRVMPLYGRDGSIVRWFGTNVDIDDQKRASQSQRFLAEAATVLASSLDTATTLQNVVRLAVPVVADWSSVYLREPGGGVDLVATAHVDPGKEALVGELFARYPQAADAPYGYPRVLRTGHSELIPDVLPSMHDAVAQDPAHRALLGGLGAVSVMTVPLVVAGRTFGAVTLIASDSGRRYTPTDLALAEELGRRIAAALDNARLYEVAQRERARAEEASRAKDDFLATLSHELRTPLTSILGWSRMLVTGAVAEDKRAKALETIDRNARVQSQLINDLLDFSRVVSGKLRLEVEPVALAQVVEAAIETLRPAADARAIRIQAALDSGADIIMGDPARLQQIAWNLLSNAVKFTPKGGRVHVTLRRRDSHVEFTIADTGEGIDPAFLPFVWERFRQQDNSITRAHGGLGLGLSIVKQLVELHGGHVEAQSDGGGNGATFVVRLPVAAVRSRSISPTPRAASIDAPRALDCPAEVAGLRVLVVDDEPDTRDVVARILEHCNAVVTTAESASEAFDLFCATPPDVLVSDIGMPGEDGYALIQRVRALPDVAGGRTPAVALTAYARVEDRTRALRAGFTSHLGKPVDPAELLAIIVAMVGRHSRG